MTHQQSMPHGVTEPNRHRNDTYVSTGWRRATPANGRADHFDTQGTDHEVEKGRAFIAVKRVGAHIGLKAADMMLLDTLGAFSQPQDWEQGKRPIIWPSNAFLMQQTGFSLSALKRHLNRLADTGTIAFKDSPNGKRWGQRDADGHIVEAYGLDLSPLSARALEFEHLYARLKTERTLCQRLSRHITITRRMIRAKLIQAAETTPSGPWNELDLRFQNLLRHLPLHAKTPDDLTQLAISFTDLSAKIDSAVEAATPERCDEQPADKSDKMDPTRVNIDPHIPTTNQLQFINRSHRPQQNTPVERQDDKLSHNPPSPLSISMLKGACPEFAKWTRELGGFVNEWNDLQRICTRLAPMVGISHNVWNLAQKHLGTQRATAAIALIFEKYTNNEVTSPNGYLRGMIRKSQAGQLRLEASFFGRMSKGAA